MIESFQTDMKETLSSVTAPRSHSTSAAGVKQDCVLAPTLFGFFFVLRYQNTAV